MIKFIVVRNFSVKANTELYIKFISMKYFAQYYLLCIKALYETVYKPLVSQVVLLLLINVSSATSCLIKLPDNCMGDS